MDPATADRPRPQQTGPATAEGSGHDRQTPAAVDRPRPQQTGPGHTTRFHACKKMLHVAPACRCAGQPSPGPATAQTNRRPRQSSLKPAITQTGRHSSRAPSRYPIAAQACCHPIRSLPRPAVARPLSTQKNAASPTGRGIPGCRHRLPYSHSIVAGGLEEMS